jgi:hypothetical protein
MISLAILKISAPRSDVRMKGNEGPPKRFKISDGSHEIVQPSNLGLATIDVVQKDLQQTKLSKIHPSIA